MSAFMAPGSFRAQTSAPRVAFLPAPRGVYGLAIRKPEEPDSAARLIYVTSSAATTEAAYLEQLKSGLKTKLWRRDNRDERLPEFYSVILQYESEGFGLLAHRFELYDTGTPVAVVAQRVADIIAKARSDGHALGLNKPTDATLAGQLRNIASAYSRSEGFKRAARARKAARSNNEG